VIYTDSETWARDVHPAQALQEYRRALGIDARLVVIGMVSNGFSIADPADRGMLDVVGFDTATPQLISDFARGALRAEGAAGALPDREESRDAPPSRTGRSTPQAGVAPRQGDRARESPQGAPRASAARAAPPAVGRVTKTASRFAA
jgi:hypothetical protein